MGPRARTNGITDRCGRGIRLRNSAGGVYRQGIVPQVGFSSRRNPGQLVGATWLVARSSQRHMSEPSEADLRVEQFVQRAADRYRLPDVAVQLLQIGNEPGTNPLAVTKCIESEPSLAARILRVLNCSLFELDHRVIGINHAVSLLGTSRMELLALSLSVPRQMFDGLTPSFLQRYWRHVLTKAVAAREMSIQFWQLPGDEPFVCGLLQEIGQLALAQDLGSSYCDFLDRVHASRAQLTAMESKSLGFDHRALSRRLLERWSFPERIINGVAWSRDAGSDPLRPDQQSLLLTMHLAGLFADALADHRSDAAAELLTKIPSEFQLSTEDLIALAEKIEEKVGHLAVALSLTSPPYGDYREMLVTAAERMMPGSRPVSQLSRGEWAGAAIAERVSVDAALRPATAAPAVTLAPRPTEDGLIANRKLLEPLSAAIVGCCEARSPLSLLLVEVHGCEGLRLEEGADKAQHILRLQQNVLREALDPYTAWFPLADPGRETLAALILPGHDRQQAVGTGNRLLAAFRQLVPSQSDGWQLIPCLGLATLGVPRKSSRAAELIEAAARCLAATRTNILGGLKSIDVF